MTKREKVMIVLAIVGALLMQFIMGVVLGCYINTGNFNLLAFGLVTVILIALIAYILNMRGKLELYDEE